MVMHLIKTSSLRLVSFHGSVPSYAILSHTWLGDEEVHFQEMQELVNDRHHAARKRSGYRKIEAMCHKARRDGYEYAWVDTCCINKKDPTELTEAINSMFRWYKKADVCYVHLVDTTRARVYSSSREAELRGCRWFSRGWCLQELIAPRKMEFYDRDWVRIASKESLASPISRITGISEAILLHRKPLASVAIAQKMAWAANRQLTKVEDTAYCLLGIFDVYMPLIYGEGDKAFNRLQKEIIKQVNDRSIFAPCMNASLNFQSHAVPCGLFASSPKEFQGLEKLRCVPYPNNHPFNFTNQGVYFEDETLSILPELGIYQMSLSCIADVAINGRLALCLRQVGPSQFVAVRLTGSLVDGLPNLEHHDTQGERRNIYVAAEITPFLEDLIRVSSTQFLRFTVDDKRISTATLIYPRTNASWDSSRSGFFFDQHKFNESGFRAVAVIDMRKVNSDFLSYTISASHIEQNYNRFVHIACIVKKDGRALVGVFPGEDWNSVMSAQGPGYPKGILTEDDCRGIFHCLNSYEDKANVLSISIRAKIQKRETGYRVSLSFVPRSSHR